MAVDAHLRGMSMPLFSAVIDSPIAVLAGSKLEELHQALDTYVPLYVYRVQNQWARLLGYYAHASWYEIVRDIVFFVVISRALAVVENYLIVYGILGSLAILKRFVVRRCFVFIFGLPGIKQSIDKKLEPAFAKIQEVVVQRDESIEDHHKLPAKGMSGNAIKAVIDGLQKLKRSHWEEGKVSGAVYHGGKDLLSLQTKVYGEFTVANQLHPDCFPALRQMEAEVIAMVLDLYNGPEGSCGTSTSGGTESLLLTCLAARQKAFVERGITSPEIIAPITVHAGIDKAAHYFNIKLIHAPVDPKTFQVNLNAVERLIGPNTILLVGSAPNFPHGIVDDIQGLSKIALKYRLPLHVDACLGSFVVPFLNELGVDIAPFDFRVPGVTSISCDTHKYGFAPKGSSVIMYRSPELRRYQYFVSADWSGGLYASPTLAGSRPGALMAGCWATLLYIGREGYLSVAGDIVRAAQKFKAGLQSHHVLSGYIRVIGNPLGPVVAFTSDELNIYDLGDALSTKGWHLSTLQNPAAIHIAFTRLSASMVDSLLADITECVNTLLEGGTKAVADGTKAFYGIAGSVSTSGLAERLAESFVDALYQL